MSGSTESYVSLSITPPPAKELKLETLRATDELGRPFLIELGLYAGTADVDPASLIGATVSVGITLPGGKTKRYFNGIVARAAFEGLEGGQYQYRLELRPWIWLLSRQQDCRIYQNKSVWDIITSVFRDAGFTSFDDKRQNQAGSQVLEYCVQYNESSFTFVTRLMERYGLYYFFTHSDSEHKLVLADDPNSHQTLGTIPFRLRDTDYRTVDANVSHLTSDATVESGVVTLNDYNFTTPSADLKVTSRHAASHSYATFEMYEYPGPYGVADDGQKLSDVRMQRFWAQGEVVRGSTNARDVATGCKFTLSKAPSDAMNQEYLVIASTCLVELAEAVSDTGGGMIDTYRCAVAAIPGDRPFRLEPTTRCPVMRGPQTAKVVGEQGQEITTDQYGRIKVQFPWDRYAAGDQTSSCWIRVAQVWAGAGWGGMFIPRIGQEVVVEFLDGDPDRPLVTGCVYNATQTVPYALPDNKTRSVFKTNSSTGGGGSNELRFEDKAGSEEVFFNAQKDYNKVVLNNETVKITQDTTTTVAQGNRSVTVSQGNNSLTVSQGNDSTTVSTGNHSLSVSAGSSTISAAQQITLKADQQITLQVGGTSITLSASGISISAPQISATADSSMSLTGGGSMSLTAGEISIN